MPVHSGAKPFVCTECFKQFKEKRNLSEHLNLHDGPRSFRCSKCLMRFSQKEERNAHEESCNRDVFECDVCAKSFGSCKTNLIRHMLKHTGETPFECQRCSKQFKSKASLDRHMTSSHTKNLPFGCLICRKGFLKDGKRKSHQRNCNRRRYECYLCKKFFGSSIVNLKGHMHTHSGVKPFQCKLCRNTFTRVGHLKVHMKKIHLKRCD